MTAAIALAGVALARPPVSAYDGTPGWLTA